MHRKAKPDGIYHYLCNVNVFFLVGKVNYFISYFTCSVITSCSSMDSRAVIQRQRQPGSLFETFYYFYSNPLLPFFIFQIQKLSLLQVTSNFSPTIECVCLCARSRRSNPDTFLHEILARYVTNNDTFAFNC